MVCFVSVFCLVAVWFFYVDFAGSGEKVFGVSFGWTHTNLDSFTCLQVVCCQRVVIVITMASNAAATPKAPPMDGDDADVDLMDLQPPPFVRGFSNTLIATADTTTTTSATLSSSSDPSAKQHVRHGLGVPRSAAAAAAAAPASLPQRSKKGAAAKQPRSKKALLLSKTKSKGASRSMKPTAGTKTTMLGAKKKKKKKQQNLKKEAQSRGQTRSRSARPFISLMALPGAEGGVGEQEDEDAPLIAKTEEEEEEVVDASTVTIEDEGLSLIHI